MTYDTDASDTPARTATSLLVTRICNPASF